MRKKEITCLTAVLLGVLALMCLGPRLLSLSHAGNQPALQWKILIVHSFEAGSVCGQPQHDGIVAALEREGFIQGKNIVLKTHFMDTHRVNSSPARIARAADEALAQIAEFNPHVLVTLDDNAFQRVALKFVDRPVKVVFCGINGSLENYNRQKTFMDSRQRPGHNLTGIYEDLHVTASLLIHKAIFPGLKKVRLLTDLSPTGQYIIRQVREELLDSSLSMELDIRTVKSWEAYRREIAVVNRSPEIGAIYPLALVLTDVHGNIISAQEILRWTIRHCLKPEIALNYQFARLGLFGGGVIDFYAMGLQAGGMVLRILRGECPAEIPLETAKRFALVFNLTRVRQLGVEIPMDILLAADEIITQIPD